MELSQRLKTVNLNWSRVVVDPGGSVGVRIEFNSDLTPHDFIKFALQDQRRTSKRSRVNGMSNAKRSIDCQIDGILSTLGIKVERLNFPAKLKIVQELGIVAPSIIGRVNKRRNYLEHEYRLPTEDEVMDAIDIAQLFIEVSERSLQEFEHVIILGAPKDKSDADGRFWHCLHLSFDEDQKQYDVRGYSDGSHIGTGHLLSNTPEYVAALKLSLSAWDFALDRRKLKKPNKLLTPLRVFAEII